MLSQETAYSSAYDELMKEVIKISGTTSLNQVTRKQHLLTVGGHVAALVLKKNSNTNYPEDGKKEVHTELRDLGKRLMGIHNNFDIIPLQLGLETLNNQHTNKKTMQLIDTLYSIEKDYFTNKNQFEKRISVLYKKLRNALVEEINHQSTALPESAKSKLTELNKIVFTEIKRELLERLEPEHKTEAEKAMSVAETAGTVIKGFVDKIQANPKVKDYVKKARHEIDFDSNVSLKWFMRKIHATEYKTNLNDSLINVAADILTHGKKIVDGSSNNRIMEKIKDAAQHLLETRQLTDKATRDKLNSLVENINIRIHNKSYKEKKSTSQTYIPELMSVKERKEISKKEFLKCFRQEKEYSHLVLAGTHKPKGLFAKTTAEGIIRTETASLLSQVQNSIDQNTSAPVSMLANATINIAKNAIEDTVHKRVDGIVNEDKEPRKYERALFFSKLSEESLQALAAAFAERVWDSFPFAAKNILILEGDIATCEKLVRKLFDESYLYLVEFSEQLNQLINKDNTITDINAVAKYMVKALVIACNDKAETPEGVTSWDPPVITMDQKMEFIKIYSLFGKDCGLIDIDGNYYIPLTATPQVCGYRYADKTEILFGYAEVYRFDRTTGEWPLYIDSGKTDGQDIEVLDAFYRNIPNPYSENYNLNKSSENLIIVSANDNQNDSAITTTTTLTTYTAATTTNTTTTGMTTHTSTVPSQSDTVSNPNQANRPRRYGTVVATPTTTTATGTATPTLTVPSQPLSRDSTRSRSNGTAGWTPTTFQPASPNTSAPSTPQTDTTNQHPSSDQTPKNL